MRNMRWRASSARLSPGYRGFAVEFGPEVTLEEDLARRDLTINAIAQADDGSLHRSARRPARLEGARAAPCVAGIRRRSRADAAPRALRRALRAAWAFTVAPETMALMRAMVERGEVDALVAERVWQETEKALREPGASVFFRVLRDCGALKIVFPEINALFGVPQPEKWHPEIDTGVHTLMVLDQAVRLSADAKVRFAALVHDLGKATTPHSEWPGHRGHEERSVALIESLCDRLKLPGEYRELSIIVARYHGNVHRAFELRAQHHFGNPGKSRCVPRGRSDSLKRSWPARRIRAGAWVWRKTLIRNGNICRRRATRRPPIKPTPEDIADQVGPLIAERMHQRRLRAITELTAARQATQGCLIPYRDRSARTVRATRSRCAASPAGCSVSDRDARPATVRCRRHRWLRRRFGPLLQRRDQRRLDHDGSARSIDQARAALHESQFAARR